MTRIDFETAAVGALPPGVSAALTGSGGPVGWAMVEDPTAPAGRRSWRRPAPTGPTIAFRWRSSPRRLRRTSMSRCASSRSPAKSTGRRASPSACSDPNNYYVVRANALEDNVRLYRDGERRRSQFAGADTKVPSGKWQELRLVARGSRFEVFLDGRSLYSATDTTIPAAGRVALWTKADSVTQFNDLRIQTL